MTAAAAAVASRRGVERLPRTLHPVAWWVWALGLATAASRTTNPLLLVILLAATGLVVAARRTDAPWALAFRMYLVLGAFVVVTRVAYRILLAGGDGLTILVTLPQVPLPHWAAGITLLGPVSLESVLTGLFDGLRLATMIVCIGAANALANPRRLLRSLPSALYEVGTAVVVAVTVFPQLVESLQRVRRARRLRGGARTGRHAVREIVVPVLADALDRALLLAASMDARGYGRQGAVPRRSLRVTAALMIVGVLGVCVGIYGVLDGSSPRYLALPMLAGGLAVAGVGFVVAGRRVTRTRYRPDRWGAGETLVALSGIAAGAALWATVQVDPTDLNPSVTPLAWPVLPVLPALGMLAAALPAWLAPPPPTTRAVP